MKATYVARADRIERAIKPRKRLFWWNLDETYDKVEARMRAMVDSGEASEHDEFIVFTWLRSDDAVADK